MRRSTIVVAMLAVALSVALAMEVHAAATPPSVEGFGLMPFTIGGAPAPDAAFTDGAYLVKLSDVQGRQVGVALWDGKSVYIHPDGAGWTIPLVAWTGQLRTDLELTVAQLDAPGPGSRPRTLVRLNPAPGQPAQDYIYTIALRGSEAWTVRAGEGPADNAAAIRSVEPGSGDISGYLALGHISPNASLKARSIKREGEPETGYVEVSGMGHLEFTVMAVECWSEEPVLALAASLSSAEPVPDVRVFAAADKKSVLPGDTLTYTYYLFNAGAQPPAQLHATFKIPEAGVFVEGSIHGEPGSVSLQRSADRTAQGITWTPSVDLGSGALIRLSFSVTVR